MITDNTCVETSITDRKVPHLGNLEHSYRIKKPLKYTFFIQECINTLEVLGQPVG